MQKGILEKGYSYNDNNLIIKDIDEKGRRVTGYFSVFGNVDSDGEIVMPGAFTRTLNNNLKRVKHLWQHQSETPLSAARTENLILKEDSYGLRFESKISDTSWGRDAIKCYADGTVDEHSIGYEVIRGRDSDTQTVERWGQKRPVKELHELKLWEGSTVTWGANPKALTESVKNMQKDEALTLISKRMDSVLKAIRNGKYEHEEIFDMLELYFEQLKGLIIDLTGSTQPADNAPDPRKEANNNLDEDEILSFIQLQLLTS